MKSKWGQPRFRWQDFTSMCFPTQRNRGQTSDTPARHPRKAVDVRRPVWDNTEGITTVPQCIGLIFVNGTPLRVSVVSDNWRFTLITSTPCPHHTQFTPRRPPGPPRRPGRATHAGKLPENEYSMWNLSRRCKFALTCVFDTLVPCTVSYLRVPCGKTFGNSARVREPPGSWKIRLLFSFSSPIVSHRR